MGQAAGQVCIALIALIPASAEGGFMLALVVDTPHFRRLRGT